MIFTLEDIQNMKEGDELFTEIRKEIIKRGHWKYKNRGSNIKAQVNAVNTKVVKVSTGLDDFSDGL